MLWEFFRFELRSRLRQPTVYLFAAVFALLGFGLVTTDAVQVGGARGQTALNAPVVIAQMLGVFSVFGVLIATAFVATAVVRDFDQRTYAAFFTSPIKRRDLLLGRFFGSLTMAWIVLAAAALGFAIGTVMPWLDQERVVSNPIAAYLAPIAVIVVPNLFVMGAVFFAVGTLTRRVLFAYVAVAGFFVVFVVSQGLIGGLENETLAACADPFGLSAMSIDTRYWTVAERNGALPVFGSMLLVNRALWIVVGAAALALTHARFRLAAPIERSRDRRLDAPESDSDVRDRPLPVVHVSRAPFFAQLAHQLRVEVLGVLRGTPFLVITLFGALNVLGGVFSVADELYGTPVYPVTALMVNTIQGASSLFVLIVIVFYAGELAWKERKLGLAEVYDALPMSSWIPLVAKLGALVVAIAVLQACAVVTAIGLQLSRGWTQLELGLYFESVFVIGLSQWALLAALALVFQALVNHKYVGFLAMIGYFVLDEVLPLIDFERALYRFGASPGAPYSDMNGYGHFTLGLVWYRVYWALGALILLALAGLMWPRGTDARFKLRLRQARRRFTGIVRPVVVLLVVAFGGVGGWIFYNTDVLNHYVPSDERERIAVLFEQRYRQYEHVLQPRVTAVDVDVELYPDERRADLRGHLDLVNRGDAAIPVVYVTLGDTSLMVRKLEIRGATLESEDLEVGWRAFALAEPLAPGATTRLDFDVGFAEPGFVERGSNTEVVWNGSFLHSPQYIPRIGYDRGFELGDPNERRKRGLPERQRMADLDDESARANTYISHEADWIDFAATVGTTDDQVALAPGYLEKEWHENGRHYFRYVMDAPILDFYAFLSARWDIVRDTWNDVAIEVYHHRGHDMNVARMVDATKKSLDYFTVAFSPYQHRQVRIVEFPGYERYAQSFPNTIPYSEAIGFIADLRDPDNIDYVFYVTAHEVAHQWWAHQVIGADVQGSTVMSETLAQYSALMVMEKEYGREHMRRFLKFELDRYLAGRGRETQRELPLMRVENQPYVHYNKGSLVMYALREYIGEDTVNRVLSEYIRDVAFQRAPYTTARELVERFRAATPPDRAYLIEDLFETITLYDNRASAARATELPGGGWEVEIDVETRKLRGDDKGVEVPAPLSDFIEVGVMVERVEADGVTREVPVALEQRRFDTETSTVKLRVDERPTRAGIDPRVLLVDRDPDDNLKTIEFDS